VRRATLLALVALAACRGEVPRATPNAELDHLVDSLAPVVEEATGLKFTRRPRAAMVTREQARAYILHTLEREQGGGRGAHLAKSYQLLGLVADSVDLGQVMLAVLGEQVAGYYDPDSSAFFGVEGTTSQVLRLTVGHELVHALQHDHLPLDSILRDLSNSDRAAAAHAVLEGQATLAMFRMTPGIGEQVFDQAFWDMARASAAEQMGSMPELARAPRILREAVVAPYFSGAEYMRWWVTAHPEGGPPYGAKLPRSTEEILAAGRHAAGDLPWEVTIQGPDSALFSDVVGALGMQVLFAEARGRDSLPDVATLGWGGDRFALYGTPDGEALAWIVVFDTPLARDRARSALADWPRPRAGYRRDVTPLEVSGRPGLRLVVAPEGWSGWRALPVATATQ
jgi:hypothetical protein